MTTAEIIRAMRLRAQQTQQNFATSLGLSISAIANYEYSRGVIREPQMEELLRIKHYADTIGDSIASSQLATIVNQRLGHDLFPDVLVSDPVDTTGPKIGDTLSATEFSAFMRRCREAFMAKCFYEFRLTSGLGYFTIEAFGYRYEFITHKDGSHTLKNIFRSD